MVMHLLTLHGHGGASCAGKKQAAAKRRKRVMVLMSDTGGGHRASAEALQAGFEQLYGDDFQVGLD